MAHASRTSKGLLDPWQPPVEGDGQPFSLADIDPGAKPFAKGDKAADRIAVDELAHELDALQDLFRADRRYKLLVVLQGTDTSGKDGTIRDVFGRMSALGVHTIAINANDESSYPEDGFDHYDHIDLRSNYVCPWSRTRRKAIPSADYVK